MDDRNQVVGISLGQPTLEVHAVYLKWYPTRAELLDEHMREKVIVVGQVADVHLRRRAPAAGLRGGT
jgi:hypothetical protein